MGDHPDPHGFEFRVATVADAASIGALIGSLAHYRSPAPVAPAPPAFVAQFQPGALAAALASDTVRYHVACQGEAVVGVAGMRDGRHLLHLFVAESHHRRGIAGALWRRARDAALGANPGTDITVRSSIFAVDVYLRFGFRLDGPRVDGPVSFVPMRWSPPPDPAGESR